MKHIFLLAIGCVLAGCSPSPQDKIKAHLEKNPAVLEFGWKIEEIKLASDQLYAYIALPGLFDVAHHVPEETRNAVLNLCPSGEDSIVGGEFWRDEGRFDSFRIIASNSRGDVVARVDCNRDFDRIKHLTSRGS